MSITKPTVSVVLLNKDEPELMKSLDLLKPQCEALGAECIVVDASDGRMDYIGDAHPWVRWINFRPPFWRSSSIPHQRNAGVRAAQSEIVAFCDAGGEPAPDWLENLTAPLLSGKYDLVCGPIESLVPGVFGTIHDVEDGEEVESPATANYALRVSVSEDIGGFEERLFYGSDADFTWRAKAAGHPCINVRSAVMYMNWNAGKSDIQYRRSWRYGRGWARLYKLHPERHRRMLQDQPERVVYSAMIGAAPLALASLFNRRTRMLSAGWLGAIGLLLFRNRKSAKPTAVVVDHAIGAASVMVETAVQTIGELPPVLMAPDTQSPYVEELEKALQRKGVPVSRFAGPTGSKTLNILLAPLMIALARFRGVRVLHIHWTFDFSPSCNQIVGRAARAWFSVFLKAAKACGVKVVWTAHNLIPHEQVFDDDVAARMELVKYSDAVIALSESSANEVVDLFDVKPVVIPHGPLSAEGSSRTREEIRTDMGVEGKTCFSFVGYLRPYKGIDDLIAVSTELDSSKSAVRIYGEGSPSYVSFLEGAVQQAKKFGADIELTAHHLSDDELGDVLSGSDFVTLPFKDVTNSGSVFLALGHGVPVVIPNLDGLSDIQTPAAFRFDSSRGRESLAETLLALEELDADARDVLQLAAKNAELTPSWDEVADETVSLYEQVVKGG